MGDRARVAILGATGHLGRALAFELAGRHALALYARRPDAAAAFAATLGGDADVQVRDLADLGAHEHTALVNCIGIGDPAGARDASAFERTARLADDLALAYLRRHTGASLVNMSSGAAYCSDFREPAAGGEFGADDDPNADASCTDPYARAKRASERRHRAEEELHIVDLRVFGFFSRHMNLDGTYLMAQVVRSLLSGETLLTRPGDIMRDYVAPRDLASLVEACLHAAPRNTAYDVYSLAPVRKFEILDAFVERFGLTYSVSEPSDVTPGGTGRAAYYSLDRSAREIGYEPTATSLEVLEEETGTLLETTG